MQNTTSSQETNALGQHHEASVPSQHDLVIASSRRAGPASAPVEAAGQSGPRASPRAGLRRAQSSGAPLTFEGRVEALRGEGFTERQAAFLVTVMLQAGVCMARQYCAFAGIAHGHNAREFFARLFGARERHIAACHLELGRRLAPIMADEFRWWCRERKGRSQDRPAADAQRWARASRAFSSPRYRSLYRRGACWATTSSKALYLRYSRTRWSAVPAASTARCSRARTCISPPWSARHHVEVRCATLGEGRERELLLRGPP
ncbi:hypothetical protein LuPra_05204 [Luteitalea pratensis]|uniref:Uncharacterized protein n=1 Tax=Luteitalea pratensis TaxID=1855912 RepID=A0A143PVT1_LUTPR|nr:hypothetical protein LuPra_05204 [Luteitalea pratensis]